MDSLREALDRLLRDNPGVRPEKLVSAHLARSGGRANDEGVRGQAEFLALARNEQILDAVEQLIGPDIILWGCHVFCKPAGDGHETPWHQDGHYWPIRPLATCTVWVALDESVTENGCLRVIPRSHLARTSHPHLHEDRQDLALQQRLPEDQLRRRHRGRPGTAAGADVDARRVHDPRRPGQPLHPSAAPAWPCATCRAARCSSASSTRWQGRSGVPVAFATRPLWLLRGRDRTGRNDFKRGFRGATLNAA